jgi:hypothetical protein
MANAWAVDLQFVPSATAAATVTGESTGSSKWVPSLGATDYALQLHLDAGTATVVLEGCNQVIGGAVAVTPDVILTATGGATGDFYAKTTAPFAYKYVRLRCTAFAAATAKASVVGTR